MTNEIALEIREKPDDDGTIRGVAVPYDQEIDAGGYRESFTRGAIPEATDALLLYGHSEPIGKIIEGRDDDDGYRITAKISDTERGREVLTLLRDRVLSKMSVGFEPIEHEERDGVTVRTKVRLREVSIVPFPAYDGATVEHVRNETETETETENGEIMSENETRDSGELVELRSTVDELERKIETIDLQRNVPAPSCSYATYGDFIVGAVRTEDEAMQLIRAYTGGTSADAIVQPAWIGDVVDIVNQPRKVLNAFSSTPLPPDGLTVEYGKLKSDTVKYEQQSAEGATLATGKIQLEVASAEVKTFGGYVEMTRQEIERSNRVSIVQTSFEAMLARYGQTTNDEVRSAVEAAIAADGSEVQTITDPDFTDVGSVIGWVYDAAAALDVYAKSIDSLIVSGDVFKSLATMVDGANRPLLEYQPTGVNNVGNASVSSITATLLGIPVIVDPGAEAGTAWFVNKAAVLSLESPGAPFRLSDQDVTALTQVFSSYGYMAVAVQQPHLIVASAAAAGFSTKSAKASK